jgi:L,D-transpeptidase ErfK/SrfK
MSRYAIRALILALMMQSLCAGGQEEQSPSQLTGGRFSYTVVPGDYLAKIGARFGEAAEVLARENEIAEPNAIKPGLSLAVDNQHIVPESLHDGIVINLPQRMLFFFRDGKLKNAYPVGLGRRSWPTVQGPFNVATLVKNPEWSVPKSIQEEMAREGQIVKNKVPPGVDNPLGEYWIGLTVPGYGIHGTIAPASVYRFQTHGCIRLHPDDVAQLFPQVSKGMVVDLVYSTVLMADIGGHVYVEINPDVYNRAPPTLNAVRKIAAASGLSDRIDWRRVRKLVLQPDGVARDVTLGEDKEDMI